MTYSINLFYSYCHKDESYRKDMEKCLSLLKRDGILNQWSDRKVLAGQKFLKEIKNNLEQADIIVFLVSMDFLNSDACVEEWRVANDMTKEHTKFLIPIILKECPWTDFSNMEEHLALPNDGKAITLWSDKDSAWLDIYRGIKDVVSEIRKSFNLKEDFKTKISSLEFCSQVNSDIYLNDLFVFPNITKCPDLAEKEITLNSFSDILNDKKVIIRGDGQSGKTTLCNHIFLNLVENKQPVLLIDLNDIENKKPSVDVFQKNYTEQYTGDFKIWNDKKDKIIIFDNLSHVGKSIEHIVFAQSYFSMVIITTSFEEYGSYFKDDDRLADFSLLTIRPFSHVKQEKLIKKWLDLKHENFEHGKIDQVENNINSIIINNNILPRYPFFILSILQTYEVFMPQDLKITAYGHCYHALIVAHLIKSGIAKEDNSITTCFNYASHLAFEIYNKNPTSLFITINDYEDFKEKYKKRFIIADSLINRLHGKYGIVKEFNGKGYRFSLAYSYYYFLGQYLAKNYKDNVNLLDDMVKYSYRKNNSLTLIFTIHHAQDEEIIDNILTYTICAIDGINPAKLDKEETAIFKDIISIIPERVISNKDVEQERNNERELRDKVETEPKNVSETEFENDNNGLNQIYQCHKNMEILSQILKNKYGSLERTKVTEIVETICDAGLRLANIFLSDSDQLEEFIIYIQRRYENSRKLEGKPFSQEQIDKIKKIVIFRIFMWVVHHLERAVSSINKPEIAEIIKDLTIKKNTPAYQLICYFYSLDTTQFFGESQKENLKSIIQKYDKKDMFFLHRILSIRTQHYMNTHEIKMPVKQAVSSLLEIK